MSRALSIAKILALLAFAALCTQGVRTLIAAQKATEEISATVKSLPDTVIADVDRQVGYLRVDLDYSLGAAQHSLDTNLATLNSTVAKTSSGILAQTSQTNANLSRIMVDIDKNTIPDFDKILENPDIPKLIRDSRATVAFSGRTMANVESTSGTIAKSAPAITDSVKSISQDTRKIADQFVAPKKWYQKLWSILMDAAGVAKLF